MKAVEELEFEIERQIEELERFVKGCRFRRYISEEDLTIIEEVPYKLRQSLSEFHINKTLDEFHLNKPSRQALMPNEEIEPKEKTNELD